MSESNAGLCSGVLIAAKAAAEAAEAERNAKALEEKKIADAEAAAAKAIADAEAAEREAQEQEAAAAAKAIADAEAAAEAEAAAAAKAKEEAEKAAAEAAAAEEKRLADAAAAEAAAAADLAAQEAKEVDALKNVGIAAEEVSVAEARAKGSQELAIATAAEIAAARKRAEQRLSAEKSDDEGGGRQVCTDQDGRVDAISEDITKAEEQLTVIRDHSSAAETASVDTKTACDTVTTEASIIRQTVPAGAEAQDLVAASTKKSEAATEAATAAAAAVAEAVENVTTLKLLKAQAIKTRLALTNVSKALNDVTAAAEVAAAAETTAAASTVDVEAALTRADELMDQSPETVEEHDARVQSLSEESDKVAAALVVIKEKAAEAKSAALDASKILKEATTAAGDVHAAPEIEDILLEIEQKSEKATDSNTAVATASTDSALSCKKCTTHVASAKKLATAAKKAKAKADAAAEKAAKVKAKEDAIKAAQEEKERLLKEAQAEEEARLAAIKAAEEEKQRLADEAFANRPKRQNRGSFKKAEGDAAKKKKQDVKNRFQAAGKKVIDMNNAMQAFRDAKRDKRMVEVSETITKEDGPKAVKRNELAKQKRENDYSDEQKRLKKLAEEKAARKKKRADKV